MKKGTLIEDFLHLFDTTRLRNAVRIIIGIQLDTRENLGECLDRLEAYSKVMPSTLFDEIQLKLMSFSEVHGRDFPLRKLYELSQASIRFNKAS